MVTKNNTDNATWDGRRDHVDTLVWTAVRYALGRKTYVVFMVVDAVTWAVVNGHVHPDTVRGVLRDIAAHRREMGRLGHDCDDAQWTILENVLQDYLEADTQRKP